MIEMRCLKNIVIFIQTVTKAWFPPGDTFLEKEIKTIGTFISSG